MLEVLFVLDSLEYKAKEQTLKDDLEGFCKAEFKYTYYENKLVVFFHKTPIIGNFFSHLTYWSISLKAAILLFLTRKRKYYKVFINPIVAIFYCLLTRIFKRKEIIIVAGFLFENKKNKFYLTSRKWLVNYCYKNVSCIIVYSKHEIQLYSKYFPKLATKFKFVKYGKDYSMYNQNYYSYDGAYVATGGASNRDFKTLLKAFSLLENKYPSLKCKIATRPNLLVVNKSCENIDVLYNIRLEIFGNFLSSSLFVIIPLSNTPLSAGHMMLLEAMYKGKIILISDIASIRDYVNEDLVYFYKPEDPYDLANKIAYLYLNLNKQDVLKKGKAAKDKYELSYNFSSLLKRIVNEIQVVENTL